MQFLKTLFWVVVAVALTLFAIYNWRPVTLNLWSGLQADVKLPVLVAIPFLPQSYLARMGTISNHESDSSASTRVQVWLWTLDYVETHPLGGGFDAYRGNSFTYYTRTVPNGTPSAFLYLPGSDAPEEP